MNDSILTSIKKMLGIMEDYVHYDSDIIIHINSVFFSLYQLGCGNSPFTIDDSTKSWSDFFSYSSIPYKSLELIKTYVYLKVKKIFDPPQNASHMNSLNDIINEYEWRIRVEVDKGE